MIVTVFSYRAISTGKSFSANGYSAVWYDIRFYFFDTAFRKYLRY